MYEGTIEEYPILFPIGEKYETINLNPGNNILIDHFNIFVFVKETNEQKEHVGERHTGSIELNYINKLKEQGAISIL